VATFVTRFAPSPTGYLHIGHAYSALCAAEAADIAGGRFLLRIEDIDPQRCRAPYEAAIYEDLAWLGLTWETPVRRQSAHLGDYAAVLDRLAALGAVYRCFKTRREIAESIASAPHDGLREDGGIFVGDPDALSQDEVDARIAAGEPYAWRLSSRRCTDILADSVAALSFEETWAPSFGAGVRHVRLDTIGDVVLARKDVAASYHLACTHDDAAQGVTHVIRGEDLFAVTPLHRVLQALLGWPSPVYRHHPLLLGPDGQRLSKRNGAMPLRELRDKGVAPPQGFADFDLFSMHYAKAVKPS
jgi:glutamyl-Q tRNA(Asp) synthetase